MLKVKYEINYKERLDLNPWISIDIPNFWFFEFPQLVIGRQTDNDVILPYPWISRKHCQLEVDEKQKCILTSLVRFPQP